MVGGQNKTSDGITWSHLISWNWLLSSLNRGGWIFIMKNKTLWHLLQRFHSFVTCLLLNKLSLGFQTFLSSYSSSKVYAIIPVYVTGSFSVVEIGVFYVLFFVCLVWFVTSFNCNRIFQEGRNLWRASSQPCAQSWVSVAFWRGCLGLCPVSYWKHPRVTNVQPLFRSCSNA